MKRIGRELVEERKSAVLGEKRKDDVDRTELVGRNLLSALVQSNMDTELPDNQRMSDEDAKTRPSSSEFIHLPFIHKVHSPPQFKQAGEMAEPPGGCVADPWCLGTLADLGGARGCIDYRFALIE